MKCKCCQSELILKENTESTTIVAWFCELCGIITYTEKYENRQDKT